MLTYHPALDVYHSAFRLLRLLDSSRDVDLDADSARILDFYLLFPHLIGSMRLPNAHRSWRRRFSNRENPYFFNGDAKAIFNQMRPIHEAAISLLLSTGILDAEALRQRRLRLAQPLSAAIQRQLASAAEDDSDLVSFLVGTLGQIPASGSNGLKDRSGLLEFRYDAT